MNKEIPSVNQIKFQSNIFVSLTQFVVFFTKCLLRLQNLDWFCHILVISTKFIIETKLV